MFYYTLHTMSIFGLKVRISVFETVRSGVYNLQCVGCCVLLGCWLLVQGVGFRVWALGPLDCWQVVQDVMNVDP